MQHRSRKPPFGGLAHGFLIPAASAQSLPDPNQGPGGPILVITSSSSTYGTYYAEILRNEGFNAFSVADIGSVTPASLVAYDVVILAEMPLTGAQVTTLSDWVNAGGNLIAMQPDAQLAGLLGITAPMARFQMPICALILRRRPGGASSVTRSSSMALRIATR